MCRNVDLEKKVLITPWGKECHFSEISAFFPLRFLKLRLRFAKKLRELDLTLQEESVLRAVVVMSAGTCIELLYLHYGSITLVHF